jgi:hypothetical protein
MLEDAAHCELRLARQSKPKRIERELTEVTYRRMVIIAESARPSLRTSRLNWQGMACPPRSVGPQEKPSLKAASRR